MSLASRCWSTWYLVRHGRWRGDDGEDREREDKDREDYIREDDVREDGHGEDGDGEEDCIVYLFNS